MEGQCQCGQIRFTTPVDKPLAIYVCHCWECRHQSSSLFGMTATFPHFKIKPPNPTAMSIHTRPNSQGVTRGYFCTRCGSRLLHEYRLRNGAIAKTVSVKSGCLDGLTKADYKKAVHVWTSRAMMDIPSGAEQYSEEPPDGSAASTTTRSNDTQVPEIPHTPTRTQVIIAADDDHEDADLSSPRYMVLNSTELPDDIRPVTEQYERIRL